MGSNTWLSASPAWSTNATLTGSISSSTIAVPDGTLRIANQYASIDSRVRVHTNPAFVDAISNHNIALSLISPESKYCKVLSADDWLTPDCLEKMVRVAETHPQVGIIGSYQSRGKEVRWQGLGLGTEVISGREICRLELLSRVSVFGNPTSSLYRSDLVRSTSAFFPHSMAHADTSAFFKHLRGCDYGFVHSVLSAERVHSGQRSADFKDLGLWLLADLEHLMTYGPSYLTSEELEAAKQHTLNLYYRFLGASVVKLRGKRFWSIHHSRLKQLEHRLSWRRLATGTMSVVVSEMQRPKVALGKAWAELRRRHDRFLKQRFS